MTACQHWTDSGVIGGGTCAKGLYGGSPSIGTCGQCPDRPADWPPQNQPATNPGQNGTDPLALAADRGLGDEFAALAAKLGADKLAAWWERTMGLSCGCNGRKAWLNAYFPGGWRQVLGVAP